MTRLVAVPLVLAVAAVAIGRPTSEAVPSGGYLSDANLGAQCLGCHAGPNQFNQDRTSFVLLHESVYWKDHDLHSRAFDALRSPLGKQIGERLPNKPDVTRLPACLVCHATDHRPGTPLADSPPDRFGCDLGVNCQACHGPGGQPWRNDHQALDWRKKSPADKQAAGLVNLRDPVVRAERCVSCHVGSATEGKFVTHAMYAAGHPPLPAFELATFSRDEPRHWRQPAAVEHIINLSPDQAKALFSYRPGEVEAARLTAVGAVTALRETARLVAAAPTGEPLDFAHFNCAACHHELVVPSDRQKNGFPGVAGRPVPTTWPVWTTRAILRLDATKVEAAGFETAHEAWRRAFDTVPFGDRKQVMTAAAGLESACAAILTRLDVARLDEPVARSVLTALTNEAVTPTARRDYLDADAAGVLARAVTAISLELETPPQPGPAAPRPPVPLVFTSRKARLNALVGLAVREADDNRMLLQSRPTYAERAERAFRFRLADFRAALTDDTKPHP